MSSLHFKAATLDEVKLLHACNTNVTRYRTVADTKVQKGSIVPRPRCHRNTWDSGLGALAPLHLLYIVGHISQW